MSIVQKIMPNRGLSPEARAVKKTQRLAGMDTYSIAINLRCLHDSIQGHDTSRIEKDTVKLKQRIENAVDVNAPSSDESSYWNPFNMAVRLNVPAFALEWLLQAGGNPDTMVDERSLLTSTTACIGLSDLERREKASVLIKYGARVGLDELKASVENDHVELFKLFVLSLKEMKDNGRFDAVAKRAKELLAVAPNPVMVFYVMKAFDLHEATFDIREDDKVLERITIVRDEIL